jgi:hypothetical protein
MTMHPVVSTNVAAVGYDPTSRTLRVQFNSGGIYDYSNVSSDLFKQMLLPNPWRRIGHVVKAHACTRLA